MKKKIAMSVATICTLMLLVGGIYVGKNTGVSLFGDPPFPLVQLFLK